MSHMHFVVLVTLLFTLGACSNASENSTNKSKITDTTSQTDVTATDTSSEQQDIKPGDTVKPIADVALADEDGKATGDIQISTPDGSTDVSAEQLQACNKLCALIVEKKCDDPEKCPAGCSKAWQFGPKFVTTAIQCFEKAEGTGQEVCLPCMDPN